jgi:hypothetical protein
MELDNPYLEGLGARSLIDEARDCIDPTTPLGFLKYTPHQITNRLADELELALNRLSALESEYDWLLRQQTGGY